MSNPIMNPLVGGLPLLRLGVDPNRNPELFRFIALCARIPGISKIDHATFVTDSAGTDEFLAHWQACGFGLHGEWRTNRYPARHIALIRGRARGFPWDEMVGLSVSDDPSNPIHRTLPKLSEDPSARTHTLQHIAINVLPNADMQEIQSLLLAQGIQFMTPVLRYDQPDGAGLRQMFTIAFGLFFVEFAQRIPNAHGEPFAGFHAGIIDDLYESLDHVDELWRSLTLDAQRKHRSWLPSHVVFAPGAP